ncbi:MAG: GNAT family N-acetyltransferase [Desulfosarcina sp.]|nr:GNAT family N-acetyltransferase [Desulfobacterales bacterium]
MPRLYIEEYTRILSGRHVSIACREGILRDHFAAIINDIKFLNRQGILTTLHHNMANRFANQKHFRMLTERLPETRIVRVDADADFYTTVLAGQPVFKLIFLERKFLTDHKGRRLNTLNTRSTRDTMQNYGDLIANTNFRSVLEKICNRIDQGHLDRVHILPARKHAIKHELFTVEGSGSLIANNFRESFLPVVNEEDVKLVAAILDLYKSKNYLKPRGRSYIAAHRENFYMTQIDGIAVGCVELKAIDAGTAELGALAISTRFRGQRVGVFTVNSFIAEARRRGYDRIISLTRNPRLQSLYRSMGLVRRSPREYIERQAQSPGIPMFVKEDLSTAAIWPEGRAQK